MDVIYAASPIYLYINPDILGYLLKPLLEYQESQLYQNPYAAKDLGIVHRCDIWPKFLTSFLYSGTNYSLATGNNVSHDEGIERKTTLYLQ